MTSTRKALQNGRVELKPFPSPASSSALPVLQPNTHIERGGPTAALEDAQGIDLGLGDLGDIEGKLAKQAQAVDGGLTIPRGPAARTSQPPPGPGAVHQLHGFFPAERRQGEGYIIQPLHFHAP